MSGVYRYYDSPDGKDFFKKEYFLLKRAFPFGITYGWFDVVCRTRPTGLIPVLERFFRTAPQPMIAVTLYNVTVYMSTRLRNKDDPINHALGVFPVAWYFSRGQPVAAFYFWAVPAAMIAFGVKQYKMWYPWFTFYREPTTYRDNRDNTIFADFFNFSMLAVKEKNWTSLEKAIEAGLVSSKEEAKAKKLTNYKDGRARGLVRERDGTEYTIHI